MKARNRFYYVLFVLIFSTLACQLPGCLDGVDQLLTGSMKSATETPGKGPVDDSLPPTITTTATETQVPSPTATDISLDLEVYPSPTLSSLSMFTPTRGWALADQKDVILVTTDGGETWLNATPPELDLAPGAPILGIRPFFLNESIAWFTPNISGSALLYQTQDGGQSWTKTTIPFDNASYQFINNDEGFALVDLGAGAGSQYVAIYRTGDGGQSWSEVFSHEPGESKSLPASGIKHGISFLNLERGWIGGSIPMTDYFYLYITQDGGGTWAQEMDIVLPERFTGSFLEVREPFFLNDTTGYLPVGAVLPSGDLSLLLYRSEDAGSTWSYQNSITNGRRFDFYSDREGWAIGGDAIYQTGDGGQTWELAVASGIPEGEFFLAVDFVGSQHGWAVTSPDDSTWEPRKLYHSSDGGVTWRFLSP